MTNKLHMHEALHVETIVGERDASPGQGRPRVSLKGEREKNKNKKDHC